MQQLAHTDPAFMLRVYSHMMRRGDEEREELNALVEPGFWQGIGRERAFPPPRRNPCKSRHSGNRSVVGAFGRDSLLCAANLAGMDRAEAEAIYDAGREACVEFILDLAARVRAARRSG